MARPTWHITISLPLHFALLILIEQTSATRTLADSISSGLAGPPKRGLRDKSSANKVLVIPYYGVMSFQDVSKCLPSWGILFAIKEHQFPCVRIPPNSSSLSS